MQFLCCPVGTPGNENSRGSHKQVYWILLLITFSTLITGSKWRRVVSEVRAYMRVYASVGARGLHRLYIIYNLTLWSACKESDRSACRAAKEIPRSLFFESRWEPSQARLPFGLLYVRCFYFENKCVGWTHLVKKPYCVGI